MRYQVNLDYKASIQIEVDAVSEDEALDRARQIAEEADNDEFSITTEISSVINR